MDPTSSLILLTDKLETVFRQFNSIDRQNFPKSLGQDFDRVSDLHDHAHEQLRALTALSSTDPVLSEQVNHFERRLHENVDQLEAWERRVERNVTRPRNVARMKEILHYCEADTNKFIHELNEAQRAAVPPDSNVPDSYMPGCNVPLNPARLTLDYHTGNTPEGRLKATLLQNDVSHLASVVVYGRGGVGKTCALRGLASDSEIKHRFSGGIHFIQLGNASGYRDIIQAICNLVRRTGSERLASDIGGTTNLKEASDIASVWFRNRSCLFLIDDIWWNNGIDSDVLIIFETMLSEDSRVVCTTRDRRFLGRSSEIIFSEKEARGKLATRMLMVHAGFEDSELNSHNEKALHSVLDFCSGLPLALGVVGYMIRTTKLTDGELNSNGVRAAEDVWAHCFQRLSSEASNLHSLEEDGSFSLLVDKSLDMLPHEFNRMFRALCVLQNQQNAPLQMLQRLWDLENLNEAEKVVDELANVSLVRKLYRGNALSVQIDGLVLRIARARASQRNEVQSFSRNLIDNYDPQHKFSAVLQHAELLQETPRDKIFGKKDAAQNIMEKLRDFEDLYGNATAMADEIIRKLESPATGESLNLIGEDLKSNVGPLRLFVEKVNTGKVKRFKQMPEKVKKCRNDLNRFLDVVTMNFSQTLPLLYSSSLTSGSLPVLQSALVRVCALQKPSLAEECCRTLISKENCKQSLEEWYAAHRLLVIAVDNDNLDPSADVDGKLFYWRDELYCMAQQLDIANAEDKKHVFRCLREADDRGLIDTPDAYIQGINTMESVREETSKLKSAALVLLNRVVKVEATAEELFQDLRSAFENYRKRQFYCNLVGIGLALIPIVGGALGKALLSGSEVLGELSPGDFMEYALSIASSVVTDENLSLLDADRREEVETIFTENRFTTRGVQILLGNREIAGGLQPKIMYSNNDVGDNDASETQEAHQNMQSQQGHQDKINEEIPEDSEHSAVDKESREIVSPGNLMLPKILTISDLAEAWASFVLDSGRTDEESSKDVLISCLLEFLENESICPETIRIALPEELEDIRKAAMSAMEQRIGRMKIGHKIRMRRFLDNFSTYTI